MKVAIFSRYPTDSGRPRGGVESVTVVLVKALAQLDDLDVHVITLERERTKVAVEQDGDLAVHKLPGSRWPQILDILAGPGRKMLTDYVTELSPDILHTHETYGLGLKCGAIPHVFTVHGFDHANVVAQAAKFRWIRSKAWRSVERRCFANQKHIISITPYVRQMVEPLTTATIYDIDNPVDERFFRVSRRPEHGRILCVGWIDERKNTLGSVEAFARIAGDYPESTLVLAGDPWSSEYLDLVNRRIEHYGISDRVELLGYISHNQLEEELARASVFLLPSLQENSPMAIAEAMAAGIPAIASNRCGMPYMISEGETGFLIDPVSTDQIAGRLRDLVGSQELCRKMGDAGRRTATERFHPGAVARRTREVYEKICAGAEQAARSQSN